VTVAPSRRRRHRLGIPEATIGRLPLYLRALHGVAELGIPTVSSDTLAAAAGVSPAQLRKDLSQLGSYGIRGVGYDVEYLSYQVSRQLGLTQSWPVLIVGVGNLGHALAGYAGFSSRGFHVAALVDNDRRRVGEVVGGVRVADLDQLEALVSRHGISIAVIAVPAPAAQEVCDRLVAVGVRSILNFAPAVLSVPDGVEVRKVDLASELQILAFHEQHRAGQAGPARAVDDTAPRRKAARLRAVSS
jgi:redox-sensing transcriptional repressor